MLIALSRIISIKDNKYDNNDNIDDGGNNDNSKENAQTLFFEKELRYETIIRN